MYLLNSVFVGGDGEVIIEAMRLRSIVVGKPIIEHESAGLVSNLGLASRGSVRNTHSCSPF